MKVSVLLVDARQRDAILAGLRRHQRDLVEGHLEEEILDIATNGGAHEGLTPEEIDALCEGINAGRQDITRQVENVVRTADVLATLLRETEAGSADIVEEEGP